MITKDMQKKSQKDLIKMLNDQRKSIEKYVGDVYKGKEKNVAKIKKMKKEVARIKTLLSSKSEKSLEQEQNA